MAEKTIPPPRPDRLLPKYPVYIPSKGRWEKPLTANNLVRDGVPFWLVVEPQEAHHYIEKFGEERVLVLPFSNLGKGSIPARNWIREHSESLGAKRHWQLDDNLIEFRHLVGDQRIPCRSGLSLATCEDLTEQYSNVAISGLNYQFFVLPGWPPFFVNCHVYSCTLFLNETPFKWRGRYNEDTDLCLQALTTGEWCTILFNSFMCNKMRTMTMKGGNMDQLYQGDGRLKMARDLERAWPGIVTVKRKFKRSQHHVKDNWRCFTTPLKPADDPPPFRAANVEFVKVKEITSPRVRALYERRGAPADDASPVE
jgi:hypothetical protein